MTRQLNRREALAGLGSVSLGALLAACADDDESGGEGSKTQPSGERSGLFDDAPSCRLAPEQTAGPFYFDADAIRTDIREDRKGATLRLALRVRDADDCEPIRNAVVDVWHCDAAGVYSGFDAGQGERFLRGAQVTGADGIVEFTTIYPGWYQGRAPHIHAKVHLDRTTVLTTQFYFDDGLTRSVYRRAPYASRGAPDVSNEADGIFDERLLLKLSREGRGYLGVMSLDVARA